MKSSRLTIHYQSETKDKDVGQDDVLLEVIKTLFLSQDVTYEKFVDTFVLKDGEGPVDPRCRMRDCKSRVIELFEKEEETSRAKKKKVLEKVCGMLTGDDNKAGRAEEAACVRGTGEGCPEEGTAGCFDGERCEIGLEDMEAEYSGRAHSTVKSLLGYDVTRVNSGFCGLSNIGNTCFMNTAIQCMANLPLFTSFFLSGEYAKWINTENKMGYGGNMARLWFTLLNELCSDKKVVKAYGFKSNLGKITDKFVDFEEQDTAEFINTVLDCLHEDLRIRREVLEDAFKDLDLKIDFECLGASERGFGDPGPHTGEDAAKCSVCFNKRTARHDLCRPGPEDPGVVCAKPSKASELEELDDVVQKYFSFSGREQHDLEWHEYLKSNTSIVSLLFSGKLLSKLECLNCNSVSKKYELFTSLSLNIPDRRSFVFLIFDSDYKLPLCIPVDMSWSVGELKRVIKYEYQIQNEVVVLTAGNGSIEKIYGEDDRLCEGMCCYEYSPSARYCWLRVKVANYIILNSYMDFVFLVRCKDSLPYNYGRVVRKLKPLMQKDLDLEYKEWTKIFDLVPSPKGLGAKQGMFPMMTMVLKLNSFQDLFGKNFSVRSYLRHNRELNLDDCIQSFEGKEYLLGSNNVYCTKCKSNQDHSKEFTIYKSPKYLILHFKRLSYVAGYCNKINVFVDFKEECVIKGESYRLQGICNHIEIAMSSGHYTATVRRDGEWYCFNDACITKVDSLVKDNAYVLFYTRAR